MNKIEQLQEALFKLGAYGRNTTRQREVDGQVDPRTRAAIKRAQQMGYSVDIDNGTVGKVKVNNQVQEYSPEVDFVEHGNYNPFFGGFSFGGGYVSPEVIITPVSREYTARVTQQTRKKNARTVAEARKKRQEQANARRAVTTGGAGYIPPAVNPTTANPIFNTVIDLVGAPVNRFLSKIGTSLPTYTQTEENFDDESRQWLQEAASKVEPDVIEFKNVGRQ